MISTNPIKKIVEVTFPNGEAEYDIIISYILYIP